MVQVTQVLSQRYVDKAKLVQLCRNEFGNGNFEIEVRAPDLYGH